MAWIYKAKFGRGQIELQENDFKVFCDKTGLIGEFPKACGLCGTDDIHLYHKSPKGNDYYGFKCANPECGAEMNMHQKKEGGFYIRYDDVWEKYTPQEQSRPQEQRLPDSFDDDVPY